MNTAPDALPDTTSLLDALSEVAEARQSKAGAFVWVHAHLILTCVREGYCASQIYRALDALGFHPPMSERQFRRYVQQLKQHRGLSASPPSQSRARLTVRQRSAEPTPPSALRGAQPTSSQPGRQPSSSGPATFDWDPTADVDDFR